MLQLKNSIALSDKCNFSFEELLLYRPMTSILDELRYLVDLGIKGNIYFAFEKCHFL